VFLLLFYFDICVFTLFSDQQVGSFDTQILEKFDSILANNPYKQNLISQPD
jgi:hypothetical protein